MTQPPRHQSPAEWEQAPTRKLRLDPVRDADVAVSGLTDTGTFPVIGPGPRAAGDTPETDPADTDPRPESGAAGDTAARAGSARTGSAETAETVRGRSTSSLLRTTGSMAVPTLISRITGFGKATAIAAVLGIEAAADSFNLANTLPNIISELVLGAVLTSVVVPVLVRAEREDADGGAAFIRRLLTVAGLVLVVSTTVAVLAAPLLTSLYLSDDSAANPRLATLFALLLLPQIFFYGYSALFGAILNTRGVFGLVAWAPVLNNVVTLLTLGVYLLTPGQLEASPGNPRLLVLGIGTTLGIVAQAVVVVPALRRAGVDLRPKWGLDARLKAFAGMALAVISYVLISQVGLVVNTNVASTTSGGVTTYNFAWLLLQVPYGVLGVSLLTAIMPRMSRAAAAEDHQAVLADLSLGSRLTTVALVPIIALFTVHGDTLGIALFSYGNSDVASAERLGATVAASAFGLLPYAVALLQLRVFYARQQAWVPTFIVACMVAVKVPLQLLGPTIAGDRIIEWLALANALSFVVGAVVGAVLLRRRLGPLGARPLLRTTGLAVLAALAGVAVDALVSLVVPLEQLTRRFEGLGAVVELGVHATVMFGVILAVMLALPMAELDSVRSLAARLGGRRTPVGAALPYPGPGLGADRRPGAGGERVSAETERSVGAAPAQRQPPPSRSVVRGPRLVPGAAVAGGRYRLLAAHGGSDGLLFWQARDTTLDRDVALTFVDATQSAGPDDPADEGPQAVLSRTQRLGRISSPALARVLDVVRGSSGGIVVAEWTAGRSLREVAETAPSPVGAARAVRALAGAAEQAHRAGSALAIDHPDRIRISTEGTAVLAFPAVTAAADPTTDVRGLGAVLYGLITAHWPLPAPGVDVTSTADAPVGGMPRAPLGQDGAAVEPRRLRNAVPFEISTVTSRSLEPQGGLRTAAAVQTVLDQAAVLDQQTDMFPAVRTDEPAPHRDTAEASTRSGRRDADDDDDDDDDDRGPLLTRGRKLALALLAFVVVAGIVLSFAFQQIGGFLGTGEAEQPLPGLNIDPGTGDAEVAPTDDGAAPTGAATGEPVVVELTAASVFSPEGTRDNADNAGLAVDGDLSTGWTSDNYQEQLPAFKNGVGLVVSLAEAATVTAVGIDGPSAGTVVEIRSAPSAEPGSLEETTVLATGELVDGRTDIEVPAGDPTQFVLVWITRLDTDGANQSSLGEITVTGVVAG